MFLFKAKMEDIIPKESKNILKRVGLNLGTTMKENFQKLENMIDLVKKSTSRMGHQFIDMIEKGRNLQKDSLINGE